MGYRRVKERVRFDEVLTGKPTSPDVRYESRRRDCSDACPNEVVDVVMVMPDGTESVATAGATCGRHGPRLELGAGVVLGLERPKPQRKRAGW